jgi:plasmid stabilization system protein ParE
VIQNVTFSPEAREELFEAIDYYGSESPGLGISFLAAVTRALDQIQHFPESAPVARGSSRIKRLPQFPYSLVYSLRPGRIRILAVMSQKRRPFYWWGRD